jgi:phage terminase large subunit
MAIQATTALKKILRLKKRVKVVRGGQGAGKTISILIILINHASNNPDKEILIVSAELTKMRLTVIKDFMKVMKLAGLYEDSRMLAGTLYKFPNGSFIKFIGLDKADVGKGLRSDVAYFNEANKMDFDSYRQIASRAKKVYIDYNPDMEFFVDTEIIPHEDTDFLQLTFQDNELLDSTERNEILSYQGNCYFPNGEVKNEFWANLWEVYGLGNIGSLVGAIFTNWKEIPTLPTDARLMAIGLDFGYSVDPSAAVAIYKLDNTYILDEIVYAKEKKNNELALLLKEYRTTIVADSAEPKSIAELQSYGLVVLKADKPGGSILHGIQSIQSQELLITSRSKNLIKEIRGYVWAVDRNNIPTGNPIQTNDHAMDAMRYGFTYVITNPGYGKYRIR